MSLAFIVTSYNIEDYIGPCLARLADCLRPGDQVIVVDDGSTDRTLEEIERAVPELTQRGAHVVLMPLGSNSPGGVGIPANIGLAEAEAGPCDGVFFVDGDDLLCPAGVQAARVQFTISGCALLVANYQVREEPSGHLSAPSDAALWAKVAACATPEARRDLALQMVGVPWRKIYRMDFIRRAKLRFPEGEFFYEDGPFHWQACLAAPDLQFVNQVVCQHRIGRAGQTMAARGLELAAFFEHYSRIEASLREKRHRPAALRWLLENMAWHVDQLAPEAHWAYAARAQEVLAKVPAALWQALAGDPVAERARAMAMALARGELAAVVAGWHSRAVLHRLAELDRRFEAMALEQEAQRRDVQGLRDWSLGQSALQEFAEIKARASGPAVKDGEPS